jgi:nucleotide-binding universal stress UspA family protein
VTYSTVMVHLNIGSPNEHVLRITKEIAERFDARVIGIGACQPMQIAYGEGYIAGDLVEPDRVEIDIETKKAESQFHKAFHGSGSKLEFRSTVSFIALSDYIAGEARATDLIVTAPEQVKQWLNATRRVNISDLVMHAGRPVMIVPTVAKAFSLENVVIGWKETRETRRALIDALPLLKQAGEVTVAAISEDNMFDYTRRCLDDVVTWLKPHGVQAVATTLRSAEGDAAQLNEFVSQENADVLVAGAYGHNRLREWALGGVTSNLLLNPACCSFVSH